MTATLLEGGHRPPYGTRSNIAGGHRPPCMADAAKDILGCVIEPGYDIEQKVSGLVKAIAKKYGGFIFTYQSFYDERGQKIVGNPSDPGVVGGT